MERMAPYLKVVAIVGALTLLGWFAKDALPTGSTATKQAPASVGDMAPFATTTPTTVTATSTVVATTTATTAVPKKVHKPRVTSNGRNAALDAVADTFINSLVNIICLAPRGSGLSSISGSGVIIDPKGIVITNAHVAQYLLLQNRGVICSVRTGRPASKRYGTEIVYISPSWVTANAAAITATNPVGTGQFDYALLAITDTADGSSLPPSFPFVQLATSEPSLGSAVLIGSYGAQFLDAKAILSELYSTLVTGSIQDVYTFGTNTVDILALGGSAAAQEGSSGGGVVDESGKLVGVLTTSTIEGDVSTRSLDAISATYIRRAYRAETDSIIDALLVKPIAESVQSFAPYLPTLEALLVKHLP